MELRERSMTLHEMEKRLAVTMDHGRSTSRLGLYIDVTTNNHYDSWSCDEKKHVLELLVGSEHSPLSTQSSSYHY